jgi:hypothetical protein
VLTPRPARADGTKVNLFCSGHTFLPDGRLLVVGGHQADGDGLDQAVLYDWRTSTWTPSAPMTGANGAPVRRWYPTATALPDGTVLVMSGSFIDPGRPPSVVDLLQIWDNGVWRTIDEGNGVALTFGNPPLYPRLHVISTGEVFMSGSLQTTQRLKTSRPGAWTRTGDRRSAQRDYCPAVMYDRDRIVYIGGGNDENTQLPADRVETIDLTAGAPAWDLKASMHFRRRQHNAVILPDGRLLVTGGTGGGGGPNRGFNDLGPGMPIHTAEMWDPGNAQWTPMSAESVDRCYHSTAVLLPDGRVLSAGGGEYRPDTVNPNDPLDSHRDAQLFSPPYLFHPGPRPVITSAPAEVGYGDEFEVGTPEPDKIDAVTWIRLPSVTHAFDENQRINRLDSRVDQGKLKVTAPATANECPPGHYMLFLLDTAGVPSVARIVLVQVSPAQAIPHLAMQRVRPPLTVQARASEIERTAHGTVVTVGITGTCPYGIGSCWGGAYEALARLDGVDLVGPVPDVDDSTARVFLEDDRLPDLRSWERTFPRIVNGSYHLRGVEVVLQGLVRHLDGRLVLTGSGARPQVSIVALEASDKVQWDHERHVRKARSEAESQAYERLRQAVGAGISATVTGPLTQDGNDYRLHLRQVALLT